MFIPVIEALVWPVFLLILLILFRRPAGEIFELIKTRIETGSEVSLTVGSGGISIGEAPKLEPVPQSNGPAFEGLPGTLSGEDESTVEDQTGFYLVHAASFNETATQELGKPHYKVRVQLEADEMQLAKEVEKITYHLHPAIPGPDEVVTIAGPLFEIEFNAWGQFNLTADLHFADQRTPIHLSRYINF